MATATKRTHKHFQLDPSKIKRAQKVLRAKTATEAIERALDFVIAEHQKNRWTLAATERFLKSGIDIKDVYGTLGASAPGHDFAGAEARPLLQVVRHDSKSCPDTTQSDLCDDLDAAGAF